MPRRKRQLSPSGTYHVVIKGTNSQLLFEEKSDFLKYLDILEYQKEQCNYQIYGYCLMSNHVHLLIHISTIPLDIVFKKISTTYSCWFNMKYQRSGPLQDGRYYSEPIDNINYLLCALRYIHYNPVKAGLETHPGEKYQWSSYASYTTSIQDITDTAMIIKEMGGIENFIEFHEAPHSEDNCLDIEKIRKRIPDDVAINIIKEACNVKNPTAISEFSTIKRNECVRLCKSKGVSAYQLNRLTGIPRGIVNRILADKL